MNKKITFLFFLFSSVYSPAQKLVEVIHQETLNKEELADLFQGFPLDYGIHAYKIRYETTDTDGSTDIASGLFVVPFGEIPEQEFPFIAYQHGTYSEREDVPSNPAANERLLAYYFGSQGYHTSAADYLGLGDSERKVHPYLHADSEASAGIDLVKAAQSFLKEEGIPYNDQLFLTGYSQGGHSSMAMHRVLSEDPTHSLEVTAGSHMSGIYNLEAEILKSSLSDDEYEFPSYLVLIIVAYQSVYGNIYTNLGEVFVDEYLTEIKGFEAGIISRGELNGLLVNKLNNNHGASLPKRMLTDSFSADFENNPDNPLRVALRENDLFDWVPPSPLRMMYCMADDQVNFTNSTFTDSVMNSNGAIDVLAIDVNPAADHGGCLIPAILNTLIFFESIAERSTTSITEVLNRNLPLDFFPNPAKEHITVHHRDADNQGTDKYNLRLINSNGIIVKAFQTDFIDNSTFPLNDLPPGLYLMEVRSGSAIQTKKILIQ